jgi:hypothetical protein
MYIKRSGYLKTPVLLIAALLLCCGLANAQQKKRYDYEVKIISAHMQNVKGILQKVSSEGLAIQDYRGNYLMFKAADMVKVKVRKRNFTIGEATAAGALTGVVIGAGIAALDPEGQAANETLKLSGVIVVCTTAAGFITGVIAEVANTKLIINVGQDPERFAKRYKELEPYIREVKIEHF